MIAPAITDELRSQILKDYLSGLSLWKVSQQYPWLKKHQIRKAVEGHVRPKNTQRTRDPNEAEIVRRRDEIRNSWPAEVASRRWVGRYATQSESRGSCLSRLFREMGGEG